MKIKFIFAWYDIWVGFFIDTKKNWLYIFPLPCFGFILKFPEVRYYLYSNKINDIVGSTTEIGLLHENMHNDYKVIKYWCKNGTTERLFKAKDPIILKYENDVNP